MQTHECMGFACGQVQPITQAWPGAGSTQQQKLPPQACVLLMLLLLQ